LAQLAIGQRILRPGASAGSASAWSPEEIAARLLSLHQEPPAVLAVDKRRSRGATSPLAAPAPLPGAVFFMVATLTASQTERWVTQTI